MRRFLTAFALLLGFVCHAAPVEDQKTFLSSQVFMSFAAAKQRWKEKTFDASKFKSGTARERAAMTTNLISSKKLLGKTPEEIRILLGGFSGFFWSDYIPEELALIH